MNQKIKIIGTIAVLVVLILGSTFLYQKLKENYTGETNLAIADSQAESVDAEQTEKEEPSGETNTQDAENSDAVEEVKEAVAEEEYSMYLDFTVQDESGSDITLESKIGKPLVINFWASWCPPCKSEMPDFQEVYLEKGEDVTFMMINMTDGGRETLETAKSFIEDQEYTFPVYFDNQQSAAQAYGISSIPTTIFIDSAGRIIAGSTGAIDQETLRKGIDMILEADNQ